MGWRALLDSLRIDARPAGIALGAAQRFSGDAAIRGPVGGEDAAFATADDASDRKFGDACCGVAGDIGCPLCGLASLSPDGSHHRAEAGADIGNALLHPIPERVEKALWL
jgi:hypothetical protein